MTWNNAMCSFIINGNTVGKAAWKINHNLSGGGFSSTDQLLVMATEQHRDRVHDCCSHCINFKDKKENGTYFSLPYLLFFSFISNMLQRFFQSLISHCVLVK